MPNTMLQVRATCKREKDMAWKHAVFSHARYNHFKMQRKVTLRDNWKKEKWRVSEHTNKNTYITPCHAI